MKLTEIDGFDITVSDFSGEFTATLQTDKTVKYDAPTLDELKEILKKHKRQQRRFKPIDVIQISNGTIGRITSKVADNESLVYFSRKDPSYEKKVRSQERLMESTGWGSDRTAEPRFARATESNLKVVAAIEAKEKEIEKINGEIKALKGTYTEKITWDEIDAADGD